MKALAGHPQPGSPEQVSFGSSLVLSIFVHSVLVLWILGSAWLLSRIQPTRLSAHTVFLGGDSPFLIDQMPGEGGGARGTSSKAAEAEAAVEKFAPVAEKPVPPGPEPVIEPAMPAPPPKPAVEKAAPPPPRPVVEKPAPPTPAPKPVVEKTVPAPPKPPPEAMTVAEKQKETKPLTPPSPPPPTATEVQQRLAQLREQQARQEAADTKNAAEAQQKLAQLRQRQAEQERAEQAARQRVVDLRTEQADRQTAQQRVAALRERLGNSGSGGTGEGSGGSGSGTAGTGSGSGAPGSGRGTGTAGAGGIGTGGIAGIRLRSYEALIQEKVRNAWMKPPQAKGLEATVYLAIDRTGHVEQLRFVRKSGNALFDESLQRAIKQAEPLPPVPEDYPGRLFERELVFRGLD